MTEKNESRLILASGSSARLVLLRDAGLEIVAAPVMMDEHAVRLEGRRQKLSQAAIAMKLAHAKAQAFFRTCVCSDTDLVIAADQILECDGEGYDKPATLDVARAQLRHLRGRSHVLQTAVVLYRDGKALWAHVEAPVLKMRSFSDAFLESYLAEEGDALLSCVGAYRLERRGIQLFSEIDGAFDAVLGLPRLPLLEALRHERFVME